MSRRQKAILGILAVVAFLFLHAAIFETLSPYSVLFWPLAQFALHVAMVIAAFRRREADRWKPVAWLLIGMLTISVGTTLAFPDTCLDLLMRSAPSTEKMGDFIVGALTLFMVGFVGPLVIGGRAYARYVHLVVRWYLPPKPLEDLTRRERIWRSVTRLFGWIYLTGLLGTTLYFFLR